jgi:hypothetical protein
VVIVFVALRWALWVMDTGIGRGWPGGQLLSLLVQRKLTKESTPRFAALRVPNLFARVRAAAQLGLRPQTVLADFPRTRAKKLAAQKGAEKQTLNQAGRPLLATGFVTDGLLFSPLQPEPWFLDGSGEAEGRRKLSERSEFFRRPFPSRNHGVSTDAGRAFFAYLLCTSKESKALPGAPGLRRQQSTTPRYSNHNVMA